MATAALAKTDYAAGILEIMRRLPLDKQAQLLGYADALEHSLGDSVGKAGHEAFISGGKRTRKTMDEMEKERAAPDGVKQNSGAKKILRAGSAKKSTNPEKLLKILDDLYAEAKASGELQDMELGFKARGL